MRWITLTKDFHCRVSDEDFEALSRFSWCADVRVLGVGVEQVYAVRYDRPGGKTRKHYMHREIVRPLPGYVVDHKSGDTLDNRRSNLRLATRGENRWNTRTMGWTSKFKGVSADKDRWRARLSRQDPETGQRITMFSANFDTEIEAALAYDDACRRLLGPFAKLNFPERFESKPEPGWKIPF